MDDFSGLPLAKRYIGAKNDISNTVAAVGKAYGLPIELTAAIVGEVLGELREAILLDSVAPDLIRAKTPDEPDPKTT